MDWKEKFLQMLGEPDTSKLDVTAAQLFKINSMPRFLYKFRPPTEEALNNLKNDTVWLSSASKYNDPFEFHDTVDFKALYESIDSEYRAEIIKMLTEESNVPEEILNEAWASKTPINTIGRYILQEAKTPKDLIDKMFNEVEEIMKKGSEIRYAEKNLGVQKAMRVCSFSERKEHLLLWGHYTGDHRGFCSEYDLGKWSSGDKRRWLLYPLVYKDTIYDATPHFTNSAGMKDFNPLFPIVSGCTKSLEWSHEKEWRFIFNIGESFEEQNYAMDCQSSVFLGHRMEAEYKEQVLDICKHKQLAVYQARLSNNQYGLTFEKIPSP